MNLIRRIIDYIRYGKRRDGLIDITDDRSFGSRAVYKPNKDDLKEALKETFIVFNPQPLDQMDSDHCVGFGDAYEADATEDFEGSGQGSGSYIFAFAKKWSGQPIKSFGTSLLAGCMARVTYGVCRKEYFDYQRGRRDYFSNWKNISNEAIIDGAKHKAGSAWQLDIPWGWTKFDAIVATLYHFKQKKVLIGTGNNAHKITVIGFDKAKDSLICQDTYGTRTYNDGVRFIDRYEARTLFTPHFVLDLERNLAEILVKYNDKLVKTIDSNDCYLISNGKRRLIPDEVTAHSHGFLLAPNDENKLVEIIESKDLSKIPKGEELEFKGGKNEWILRRTYELNKIDLKY